MKTIQLTQGKLAIVDAADYEWLSQWKWYVMKSSSHCYAARTGRRAEGEKYTKKILMHRVINRTPEHLDTDHINGEGLDNRRVNLRSCEHRENMWNSRASGGASKHKGVHWHKRDKVWYAGIKKDRVQKFLGTFKTEIEAAHAYNTAATELFGEFARLNEVHNV